MASDREDNTAPAGAMGHCPNCDAPHAADPPPRFCPDCGQDNSRSRLQARAILLDALHNFVGWDSALYQTLRGLATGPGRLVTRYVAGMRRAFVNPARFCLLSLALWFFTLSLAGVDPLESSGLSINDNSNSEDTNEKIQELRQFLAHYMEVLLYLALPMLALILKWLFRRSGRNLAECLVLVLYLVGFRYLVGALLVPLHVQIGTAPGIDRMLFGVAWFIWAARDFFQVNWWSALWRVLLAFLLHMIATLIFFSAVALPVVFLS